MRKVSISRSLARAAAILVLVSPGCAPAAGPLVLEGVTGRVVDEDTGEPIPGATVIEWYRGGGRFGEPQPAVHARFATTDRDGRFAFERELARSLRLLAQGSYGPVRGFYHPSYGLETATPRPAGADPDTGLLFEGSLRRAHLGLEALRPYCDGRRDDDAAAERLRAIACPLAAHDTWPSGVPRAEGPLDERGRRTGEWTFRYEDGRTAARGHYREGGATSDWEFYDRSGARVGPRSATPR